MVVCDAGNNVPPPGTQADEEAGLRLAEERVAAPTAGYIGEDNESTWYWGADDNDPPIAVLDLDRVGNHDPPAHTMKIHPSNATHHTTADNAGDMRTHVQHQSQLRSVSNNSFAGSRNQHPSDGSTMSTSDLARTRVARNTASSQSVAGGSEKPPRRSIRHRQPPQHLLDE